jgi:hypothetical protein
MSRVATLVPDETDILCEGCGYTLKGLPQTGNCPECGKPIEQSLGIHRELGAFERRPSLWSFLSTSAQIWFAPAHFYASVLTRTTTPTSLTFARIHRALAALLFAAAFCAHAFWVLVTMIRPPSLDILTLAFAGFIVAIVTYALLEGITALAGWLSAIEARYWGMRLPRLVVVRALRFHSACYLPVGLLAVSIVWGNQILLSRRLILESSASLYLYTLCAAVIVSAVYLFVMYWIAMKNMMYANR